MLEGLNLAWEQGYRRIIVEFDLRALVELLQVGETTNSRICTLYTQCQRLLAREWNVQIKHTYREGNKYADWLASYSITQRSGLYILQDPLIGLHSYLLPDVIGIITPRVIPMQFFFLMLLPYFTHQIIIIIIISPLHHIDKKSFSR